jgi:hypothetical protein
VEAKGALDPSDFSQFCDLVGLDQGGSTFRKLQKIGDASTRFQPVLGQLPNTWTTIYKLAKLEPSEFERIVDYGILTPFMTASEISGYLKPRKKQDIRQNITLSCASLSKKQRKALMKEITKLQESHAFEILVSPSLKDEFA